MLVKKIVTLKRRVALPEKILPNSNDFNYLKKEFKLLGFKEISNGEFSQRLNRLGLKSPRFQKGRETGFYFKENGLTITVWTTWLEKQGQARESDAGWVVISEDGLDDEKAVYFSHPIHRTKNFIINLLAQAWIAQWRIKNRPHCPQCKGFMKIVRGRAIKSRYWRCSNRQKHQTRAVVNLDWDNSLPPKAKEYLKKMRKKRAQYKGKRRQEGKRINQSIINRLPWKNNGVRR